MARPAVDAETVLFYLRGLPTFPNSELSREPLLPEPAFANTFGPPTLIHEVYLPPSRAKACPECVYVFLEQARVLQNASQWDAALDKLETARRIWVDKRVWPILGLGLDPFAVRAMAAACLKREAEESRLRKEWEAARQQELVNRRREREAKENASGNHRGGSSGRPGAPAPGSPRNSNIGVLPGSSDAADSELDFDLPTTPPFLLNKSEVQLAREAEELEAKRLCAMIGSATPEEELEFYVYLWMSTASVHQSRGEDKQALLYVWRARVAIAEYTELIQASAYNKDLGRKLRRLRALAVMDYKTDSENPEDLDDQSDSEDEDEDDEQSSRRRRTAEVTHTVPFPLAAKLRHLYRDNPSHRRSASNYPASPQTARQQAHAQVYAQSSGEDILGPVDIHSINLYESDGEDDGGNPPFVYPLASRAAAQTFNNDVAQLGFTNSLDALGLKAASAHQSKQASAIAAISSSNEFDKSTTAPVPAKDELTLELQRLGLYPSDSEASQTPHESKEVSPATVFNNQSSHIAIPQSITDLVLWSCDQPRLSHDKLELIDVLGPECSPVLASVFSALGVACARLNEIPLALSCFRAAKDIRFKCIPPSSAEFADVGVTLNNIGVCLTSLRRPREALAYLYAAMDTFSPRIENTHPRINAVMHNIERVRSITDLVRLDMTALRALVPIPNASNPSSLNTTPALAATTMTTDGTESTANKFDPSAGLAGLPGTTRQIKLTQYQKLLVQYNASGGKKPTTPKPEDADAKKKGKTTRK